jgi:hypothetical protein
MLGKVFIRTGSVIAASGVRVVSGLVQRLGTLSFISDNAGCLGGRPFPRDGRIMSFGSHEVYVGTKSVCREKVLVAADPPSHMLAHAGRSARPVESAEVMMAGTPVPSAGGAGKAAAVADTPPEQEKAKRSARPPWSALRTWPALPACRLGASPSSPSSAGFLSRCSPATIRSRRRRSWRDPVRPSSTRPWPCIRSASGSTDNSVSMRLPKVLLLW